MKDNVISITETTEDYLRAIYELQEDRPYVSNLVLAERLNIKPASATGMVKRLADRKLVEYEPYQGVSLTEEGKRLALQVLRSHRLVELYLVEKLGVPWDQVHAEADRWEHVLSDELADRMDLALGHPIYDPHGSPIPTRDGRIDQLDYTLLAELQTGQSATVAVVQDQTPALLRYLAEVGLTPGVSITVIDVAPFEGPLTLRLGQSDTQRVIGRNIAQKIALVDIRDQRTNRVTKIV